MHDNVHVRLMITWRQEDPSQHPSNNIGGPNIVIIAEHKAADPDVRDRHLAVHRHGSSPGPRHARPEAQLPLETARGHRPHPGDLSGCRRGPDARLTGAVATCNATNFFIFDRDGLHTATGQYNLNGITSELVCEVAEAAGIPVHQHAFSLTDVYAANEAFVTGTFGGLHPRPHDRRPHDWHR